jgi:hypothetical protein
MVLTNSVGFAGTWLLTIFMFLASTYLVCWDYDRWKPIIFYKRGQKSDFLKNEFIWLPILFAVGGMISYILLAYVLLQTVTTLNFTFILILGGFGLLFGLTVTFHHKYMQIGKVEPSGEKLD